MKRRNWAPIAWIVGISLMLVYEAWSILNGRPGDTLSEAVWAYGQHPMLAFAVGVLMGHFFWQGKK